MHRILVIVGSGIKNGNTDKLADAYRKGAEANGHVIYKVFLGDKKLLDVKDVEHAKMETIFVP